ncbi:MAG: chemotaxis protein CheW [Bdellovibrionales bacterium]|nr:chemotaxis protein CheW [Bdellovibrionales bacterium]
MNKSKTDGRFMEFRLGEIFFAVPLLNVREVLPKPDTTHIPNMPPHFEGMINLRGQIVGVFNVAKKLNPHSQQKKNKPNEVVIVIEKNGVNVGMIVDEVTKVLYTESDKISPAPLKKEEPSSQYIDCVIQNEEGLVMTINIEKLLELNT